MSFIDFKILDREILIWGKLPIISFFSIISKMVGNIESNDLYNALMRRTTFNKLFYLVKMFLSFSWEINGSSRQIIKERDLLEIPHVKRAE